MGRTLPDMLDDIAFQRLLRDQDGVFTRAQLVSCGGTDGWIEAQLTARRIQRLHRKVLLSTTGEPTRRQRERAALLSAGPRAALSHATAARRHGMTTNDDTIHVTVPYGASADPRPGVMIHRSRAFDHIVVDELDLPTVSAPDTCLDLAATAPDARAAMRQVLHAALSMKVSSALLRAVLERRRPPRYARAVRAAVEMLDEGVASALEAIYAVEVEDGHGLPRARRQVPVDVAGTTRYEDLVYELPGGTVTVRLDGWRWHSDRHVAVVDRARDNAAQLAGRSRLSFGWEEVHEPCATAAIVATALRDQGWAGPDEDVNCACVSVPQHGNARTRR